MEPCAGLPRASEPPPTLDGDAAESRRAELEQTRCMLEALYALAADEPNDDAANGEASSGGSGDVHRPRFHQHEALNAILAHFAGGGSGDRGGSQAGGGE